MSASNTPTKGKYKDLIKCHRCDLIFSKKFVQKHFEDSVCCAKILTNKVICDAISHNFNGFIKENAYYFKNFDKNLANIPKDQQFSHIFIHPEIYDVLAIQDGYPLKLEILTSNSLENTTSKLYYFMPLVSAKLNASSIGISTYINNFLHLFANNEDSEKTNKQIYKLSQIPKINSTARHVNLLILSPSSPLVLNFVESQKQDFGARLWENRKSLPISVGTIVPFTYKEINMELKVTEMDIYEEPFIMDALLQELKDCKLNQTDKKTIPFDFNSSETAENNYTLINVVEESSKSCQGYKIREERNIIAKLDESTQIVIAYQHPAQPQLANPTVAGIEDIVRKLRYFVQEPLLNPTMYSQLNFHLPKGILLYGPSGVGKTMSVNRLVNEMGASIRYHSFNLKRTSISDKSKDVCVENKLRDFFETVLKDAKVAPTLAFIDEIDAFFPNRSNGMSTQAEKAILATFLTFLDEISAVDRNLIIITATNNIDSIDLSLRRPGRLEYEIEYNVPTPDDRLKGSERNGLGQRFNMGGGSIRERDIQSNKKILKGLLQVPQSEANLELTSPGVPHQLTKEEIVVLSESTHGYTGADLVGLVNMAGMVCLERVMKSYEKGCYDPLPLRITNDDFTVAIKSIKPSAMREITLDIPKVRWEDIGGVEHYKDELLRCIRPLIDPKPYRNQLFTPERGLILHGPPGCSKTMIAKALATETRLNFFSIKGPEIFNKYVGESERMIRELFRKAKRASPSIIFFDEIDAIASERGSNGSSGVGDRVLAQLLTEMDGVERMDKVFVLAATNRIDKMDKALLRPGRFGKQIHVPLPDFDARSQIIERFIAKMMLGDDVSIGEALSKATQGFSGAEVAALCNESAMLAHEKDVVLCKTHFEEAFHKMRPHQSIDWD